MHYKKKVLQNDASSTSSWPGERRLIFLIGGGVSRDGYAVDARIALSRISPIAPGFRLESVTEPPQSSTRFFERSRPRPSPFCLLEPPWLGIFSEAQEAV